MWSGSVNKDSPVQVKTKLSSSTALQSQGHAKNRFLGISQRPSLSVTQILDKPEMPDLSATERLTRSQSAFQDLKDSQEFSSEMAQKVKNNPFLKAQFKAVLAHKQQEIKEERKKNKVRRPIVEEEEEGELTTFKQKRALQRVEKEVSVRTMRKMEEFTGHNQP